MKIRIASIVILSLSLFAISCRKDGGLYTKSDAELSFSKDTVIFDTVFTTIGSSTRNVKVYNPYNKPVIVSSIRLARGAQSSFRLNIDGEATSAVSDVEIAAGDSIFIFVEVTVDPNKASNPMIITDSILFQTNGNAQDVDLVAWGQDAYFYAPPAGQFFFSLTDQTNVTLSLPTDKPHVVYGYLVVDSTQKLVLDPGTKLHFHQYSGIAVANMGTLEVNGTKDNRVTFEGDRLEMEYDDVPGQWGFPPFGSGTIGSIWLAAGSVDNKINYAIIRNGTIGIQVDTVGNSNPALEIHNTIINTMSLVGLHAQGSHIVGTNNVIANCGQHLLSLTIGGFYSFKQCTFDNRWDLEFRETASILVNNWYEDADENEVLRGIDSAYFGNCIVYGNIADEVKLDSKPGANFNYEFDHCMLKTTMSTTGANYTNIVRNSEPSFVNTEHTPHALDTNSAMLDKGGTGRPMVTLDIEEIPRATPPDPGAFERL